MSEQEPHKNSPEQGDPAPLNYQSPGSNLKSTGRSGLRILGMVLLIVLLVGLLAIGICTWSVMHA